MTATSYSAAAGDATGYRLRKGQPRPIARMEKPFLRPAGFLYSNADDLSRFAIAFMNGGVEQSVVDAISRPHSSIPSERRQYGYGAFILDEGGDIAVFHPGDEPGASAMLKMIPSKKAAVIVLMNLQGRMPRTMATALRLAGGVVSEEEPPPQTVPITRRDVDDLAGTYMNYNGLRIRRGGDTMVVRPWLPWFLAWLPLNRELVKFGDDRYGIYVPSRGKDPVKFTAIRGAEGKVEMLFVSGRVYKRV